MIHPNSIKNLTNPHHDRRPPLPYNPIALKIPLDPDLVEQIDKYKAIVIPTKNGRNRAIAQLLQTALAIALNPALQKRIQAFQAQADVETMDEAIMFLLEMGLRESEL